MCVPISPSLYHFLHISLCISQSLSISILLSPSLCLPQHPVCPSTSLAFLFSPLLPPFKYPVLRATACLTNLHSPSLHLLPLAPRKDPTLRWAAGPTLGRSFTHGPELEKGQLYIHRAGIYRLHVQVTLANCSSACSTVQHRATVTVAICSPAAHSISLLRLPFGQSCTVASQRLTHLAVGDVLCTNLTLPLLPSRNAEETFFGVHWICP
ncbi:CD70 antigen [Lemmus lemmus]